MCWKGAFFFQGWGTQWVVSWGGFMCNVIICLRCSCEPPTKRWVSVCLFLSTGPFSMPLLFPFFFRGAGAAEWHLCSSEVPLWMFFYCTVQAALPGSIVKNGCPSQVMAFLFRLLLISSFLIYFTSSFFFLFGDGSTESVTWGTNRESALCLVSAAQYKCIFEEGKRCNRAQFSLLLCILSPWNKYHTC